MTLPLLLIDSGNTRVKYALFDGQSLQLLGSIEQTNLSAFFLAAQKLPPIRGSFGCNVAGPKPATTIEQALSSIGAGIQWASPLRECAGVNTHYENLQQLGPDRWLSVLAARQQLAENLVVVNAGTALTVDCLTASGDYLGGTICPGFRLMRDALAQHTARLGRPDGAWQPFPVSTATAINTGIINALVGAIEQQARQLQEKAGPVSRCLLSGGDAELLAPHLSLQVVRVENLVLEGLRVLPSL